MTATECEQSIVDFTPMLSYLVEDFKGDKISRYFIPPSFETAENARDDLHTFITAWLENGDARPVAIWAGYGMGKTSYARFLAAALAEKCLKDYGAKIPILLRSR